MTVPFTNIFDFSVLSFTDSLPTLTANILFSSSLHRKCVMYKKLENIRVLIAHLTTEEKLNIEFDPQTIVIHLANATLTSPLEIQEVHGAKLDKVMVSLIVLLVFLLLVFCLGMVLICGWLFLRRRRNQTKKRAVPLRYQPVTRTHWPSARKSVVIQKIYFSEALQSDTR